MGSSESGTSRSERSKVQESHRLAKYDTVDLMILFDIDGTLSPTRKEEAPATDGVTARAFGFQVFVPQHLLDFLRSREDIVMLSTWGKASFDFIKAFGFEAQVALIEDFSDETGPKGKFEVVKKLQPSGWADDHIKPAMKKYAAEHGIAVTVPRKGYITEAELKKFKNALSAGDVRLGNEFDKLILKEDPRARRA